VPRRTRIRSTPLEDLARQQRFTPSRAILKQIARAEELAAEVDPEQSYPEEWVVFRITGYRPAATGASSGDFEAAVIPGSALIGDLSAFVERLSDDAALSASAMGEGLVSSDDLCARWNVSRKTLERYRRRGLIARRTRDARGHVRLAYSRTVIEAFEMRERARLQHAASFERVPAAVRERVLRGAKLYALRLGWTLNQAAGRLALRYGIGHETVRQMLIRHDESGDAPIFDRQPPLSVRDRRLALRAYERGITPARMAKRLGRSTPSVHRVILLRRLERLRRVPAPGVHDAAFELPDVEKSLLSPLAVRTGFGASFPTDVLSLAALARAMPPVDAAVEHARAAAMQYLWWRATSAARSMALAASSSQLDRAETDLRWMLRLKAELLRAELGVVIRAIEERAGRPLHDMPSGQAHGLLLHSMDAAVGAIDRHDPFRGGRLAAPVSLAVTRVLAGGGGVSVHAGPLPDWSLRLTPWQSRFEPDPRLRDRLGELPDVSWRVLAMRFGWGADAEGTGEQPMTRREVSEVAGFSPQAQMTAHRRAIVLVRSERKG